MSASSRGRPDRAAAPLWPGVLHVGGIWALAIAQPVLDLLGRSPEFFVAHRAGAADILALVGVLLLAGPLLLTAVLVLVRGLRPRLYRASLAVVVGTLFGLLSLSFLVRTPLADPWILGAAVVLGTAATFAYQRSAPFRQVLTILSLSLVVVPAAFLARPSIRDVMRPVAGGAVAAESSPPADGPTVVLVIYDQFPLASLLDASGSIDADLYPSFAALAATANWYPNVTSVANKTAWAVPAIATGVYPSPDRRLPSFQNYPDTVFRLLADGYALHAREPVTELCPRGRCEAPRPRLGTRVALELQDAAIVLAHALAPPRLAAGLPPVDTGWKNFAQAAATADAGGAELDVDPESWNFTERWVSHRDADRRAGPAGFIASIQREDRPALYFLHMLLPHEPYILLPSGQRYSLNVSTPGLMPDGSWHDDPYATALNYQRFLLQAGYADRILGDLIARLGEAGMFDDCLLIVTADHGTSFKPGTRFKDPQSANLSDILSVPLLVKLPGQRTGRVDARRAETVDVLPTIAEVVGRQPGWQTDGRSLLADAADDRTEKLHYYGGAQGPMRLDPESIREQLDASVQEKLRLMGPDGDASDGVRFGPHPELLGRSVADDEFRVVDLEEGNVASLSEELLLSHADLGADLVPRHLNGFVVGDPARFPTRDIAVAVNGVIQATGEIYSYPVWGRDGYWSVVLPEEALQDGYNAVEVFLILPRERRTALRRIYANPRLEMPTRPNLLFEDAAAMHGFRVWTSGLMGREMTEAGPVRWTDGHARLRVQPPEGFDWRALEVTLRYVDPSGAHISILVDGCTLYEATSDEAWSRTFDLGDCAPEGPQALIEIVSDTFEDGPVTRGVGVLSLVPLGSEPTPER